MAVCSDCWSKIRAALHWDTDDVRSGLIHAMLGSVIGFILFKAAKYPAFLVGLVIVTLDLVRRQGVINADYEWALDEVGLRLNELLGMTHEVLANKHHRGFLAGLMVGASTAMK